MKSAALLLVSLSSFLLAQQPNTPPTPSPSGQTALDQQPDSKNDIDIENWINFGGKTVSRLMSLGVEKRVAESIDPGVTGGEPVIVKWQMVRAGKGQQLALIFLPCHAGWDLAYLYTLTRRDESWRVADHVEADCHYDDNVSFEIVWIRDPNRDEVLLHHACEGRGTGYLEQHFLVFAISDGKLKEELETKEVFHSYPTAVERRRDLDQSSTFTLIPIRNSRLRAIEETRSSALNGKLTVQRRIFRWDAARGKYVPSAFANVEASPN
jgi:hypothetical protein